MTKVVILGASVAGSAAALQLARRGYEVALIDKEVGRHLDHAPFVSQRPGAPHVVHAHALLARNVHELRARMPDIYETLLAKGAELIRLTDFMPPGVDQTARDDDDDLVTLACRRATLDSSLWSALLAEPNITASLDTSIAGLETAAGQPPRVTGVRLASDEVIAADVVIDAAGRRSPVPRWLADVGVEESVESWNCGQVHYTRHYAIRPGPRPALTAGFATVAIFPTWATLWFLGDDNTAMLACSVHNEDPLLKHLRHEAAYDALVSEIGALQPWLEISQPTTPVFCMGSVLNTLRRQVSHGTPQVLGGHHVGDSLAVTNPNRGRGVGMALAAVGRLVDLIDEHPGDPVSQALEYDSWVTHVLAPYFRESATWDVARSEHMRAALRGEEGPAPAPTLETLQGPGLPKPMEVLRASTLDPDVWRAVMRAGMLMDDDRSLSDPAMLRRLSELVA